tara:strand:+ start:319 stop:708 length:390 start_codon:yes stop_codon:yes gene_type:complete
MPVGPGGEPLPYPGDPGAAPPPGGPPAQGGGDILKAFADLGGDVSQPEQTPEVVQQLAEQLGIPPEQLIEMLLEEGNAYNVERGAAERGAQQALNPPSGPVGTTPPQMGGGEAPQGMTGGAGQYRPRRM